MFEVDLVGGPMDGRTYVRPDLCPYLYFPYVTEQIAWPSWAITETEVPAFAPPKLVYRHILHGLYWYQGTQP